MDAAIGQSFDIPIFLRTLAFQLYQSQAPFSLPIDREFLLSLDAGSDSEDLAAAVDSYHLPWWNFDEQPSSDGMICDNTINEALRYHRSFTANNAIMPFKVNKYRYTWPRHLLNDPKGLPVNCDRCRLYRGVALGVLDNLQDLRHQVHALEVTAEYHSDIAERRAAGFFQLYDAALMKELSDSNNEEGKGKGKQNTKPKGNKKRQAAAVRETAAAEFNRLTNLPSLKWHCCLDLTVEDILALGHPLGTGLKSGVHQHSGYNSSLPWGRYGEDSSGPASPTFSASNIVSDIADDNVDVPELDVKDIPTHFTCFPLRNFADEPHPLMMQQKVINPPHVSSWLHPPSEHFIPSPPNVIVPVRQQEPLATDKSIAAASDSDISAAACDVYSDSDTSVNAGDVYSDPGCQQEPMATVELIAAASDSDISAAACDVYSDSDTSVNAGDVYSVGSSSVDAPGMTIPARILSSPISVEASLPDDRSNSSISSYPNPEDVYSSSESICDVVPAADAFSSSDIETEDIQAADVFSDNEIPERNAGADPSNRTIPGPFNSRYFSNIPNAWLDVESAVDGNIPYDTDDD